MSGLDKLIAIAEEIRTNGYGPSPCRVLLASRIEGVASEIEQDIFRATVGEVNAKIGCAWRNLAEYMNGLLDGKYEECDGPGIYRRCERETFQEWLDKWYIPKPLDADGEPIRFGDLFEYKGEGKPEKLPVTGFEFYEDGSIYLYFKTAPNCAWTPRVEDARRANTDSIEKLRGEMINLTYASAEEAESLVDEWLARAERLFGGDAE